VRLARLIQAVDDRINPIVVKELRQAVQSRFVVTGLGLFLVLQLFVLGFQLLGQHYTSDSGSANYFAGRETFHLLQMLLLGTVLIFVPLYTGIRLAAERSDVNVDLMFISALRPRSIVAGKLFAALMLTLLMFSACAPFMTFSYLLRGIDIPSILLVLFLDLLAVLGCTQAAIVLASIPANRLVKGLLGLVGLFLLGSCLYATINITSAMIQGFGMGLLLRGEALVVLAAWIALALLGTGLLFTCSVAMISPPSANRALPVRLMLFAVWLGSLAVALISDHVTKSVWGVSLWAWANTFLFCGQIVIAINERDRWAPRVARTIPRPRLLRILAFLFYSGAGGGVVFAVLILIVTWFIDFQVEFSSGISVNRYGRQSPGLLVLYTLCYSLTAVFIGRVLLGARFKAQYTWVLAAVLVGLGGSLPMIAFLLVPETYDRGPQRTYLWMAGNPVVAVTDPENSVFYLGVTFIWSVLAVLACSGWFFDQVRAFRPPKKAKPQTPVKEPVLEVLPAGEST
jgi:hypothetical protein